jgi:hypothetical protein
MNLQFHNLAATNTFQKLSNVDKKKMNDGFRTTF